ncbi:MAG: hypothetical protein MJZ13_08500 [Bacteroidales bacterium]|nr:hypothetical protein [Bacteroidales bacterium]
MKKIIILSILFIMPLFVLSQNKKKYYSEIKGIEKEFNSGLYIVFDFGNRQVYDIWGGLSGKQRLVDESGEKIPFNSMVDAGNYLSDRGWEFLQAYTSVYDSKVIVHWIFCKEAENLEQAIEGIMTKEMYNQRK